MNTENYEFGISACVDLDIPRIIRENSEEQIIVITSGENALMLLHPSLLNVFVPEDEVVICGECLSTNWGYSRVKVLRDRNETIMFDTFSVKGNRLLGWKTRRLGTEDVSMNTIKLKRALERKTERFTIKIKVNTWSEEDWSCINRDGSTIGSTQ